MSAEFAVDLEELDDVVTRLKALAGFLTETFDEIDREVKALRGGGSWDSAAAQAYSVAHSEWLGEATEFGQGVADAGDAARQAHANYTAAMNVNEKMARG